MICIQKWLRTLMILIRILNLSGRGKGAARMKNFRPRSLLRVPKDKKRREPELSFDVSSSGCKFLIYIFDFHPFLTDNDFIIKCLYYRYLLVGNEKVKKKEQSPKINWQWSNHKTATYQNWVEIDAVKSSKNNTLYYLGDPTWGGDCESDYYDANLGSGLDLEPYSAR